MTNNNEMPVTIWVTKVDSSHARIWGVEVHDSTQYHHHDTVVPKEQYDKVASYLYHVSKAAGDVDGIMISGGKTEVADKHDAEINHLKTKIGEYQTRIELQAEDIEALEAERDALREALGMLHHEGMRLMEDGRMQGYPVLGRFNLALVSSSAALKKEGA